MICAQLFAVESTVALKQVPTPFEYSSAQNVLSINSNKSDVETLQQILKEQQ